MPIQTRVMIIRAFECDKCHHVWTPKKKDIFDKNLSKEEQDLFLKKNKPKICPKCKSKDWNYLNRKTPDKVGKKTLNLIEKKYGKESAEFVRAGQDKEFHKKIIHRDIEKAKKELEYFKSQKKNMEGIIQSGESVLKELEEEKEKLGKIKCLICDKEMFEGGGSNKGRKFICKECMKKLIEESRKDEKRGATPIFNTRKQKILDFEVTAPKKLKGLNGTRNN